MHDMEGTLALDQAGVPQFSDGRPLSQAEREDYAVKLGKCPKCGIQVKSISSRKLLTFGAKKISNDDVHEGFCIAHAPPGKVPAAVIAAWEARTGRKALVGGLTPGPKSTGSSTGSLSRLRKSQKDEGSTSSLGLNNLSVRSAPARSTQVSGKQPHRLSATDGELDFSDNAEESVSEVTEIEATMHESSLVREASRGTVGSSGTLPQIDEQNEKRTPLPSMHVIADLQMRARAIRRSRSSDAGESGRCGIQRALSSDGLDLMRAGINGGSALQPSLQDSGTKINAKLECSLSNDEGRNAYQRSPRRARSRDSTDEPLSSPVIMFETRANARQLKRSAMSGVPDGPPLVREVLDESRIVAMPTGPPLTMNARFRLTKHRSFDDADPNNPPAMLGMMEAPTRGRLQRHRSFDDADPSKAPTVVVRRPSRDGTERIIPVRSTSRELGDMRVPGIRGLSIHGGDERARGVRPFHSSDEMGFELMALARHASMASQDDAIRRGPRRANSRSMPLVDPTEGRRAGLVREKSTIITRGGGESSQDIAKLMEMVKAMDKKMDGFIKTISELREEISRERELRLNLQVDLHKEKELRTQEKIQMLEKQLERERSGPQLTTQSNRPGVLRADSGSSFPESEHELSRSQLSRGDNPNSSGSDSEETLGSASSVEG